MLSLEGSQLWKANVKVRGEFRSYVKFCDGNDTATQFPFTNLYIDLSSYCSSPEITISELSAKNWDIDLHRSLSPYGPSLTALFPPLSEDEIVWSHSSSGKFSIRSL